VAAVDVSTGLLEATSSGGAAQLGLTTRCPGGGTGPCVGAGGGGVNTFPAPSMAASDGASVSGVGGFGSGVCPAPNPGGQGQCLFFGTSAAAPHAAGCDALVRGFVAGSTVTSVRNRLLNTAVDMGAPGVDNNTGAGLLDCYAAIGGPVARCQNIEISADDLCEGNITPDMIDDGSFDPDGTSVTLSLDTSGPFPLGGPFPVVLSVTDGTLTTTCSAGVTVVDDTDPVLSVFEDRFENICQTSGLIDVGESTATDNCANPPGVTGEVVSSNGTSLSPTIPVTDGSVELDVGTHIIVWTATDGVNTVEEQQIVVVGTGIQTGESFVVADGGRVSAGGSLGAVINSGSGITRIGNDAFSGSILSVGPVEVQHRATVDGDIVSQTSIFVEPDANFSGDQDVESLALPGLPVLPAFPPATLGSVTVNTGTRSIASGSYASATVNGGTLELGSGDYFFDNLTIFSGTVVRVTADTRVFVENSLVFSSSLRLADNSVAPIYMGFAGASVTMEARFDGTFVAPNAAVTFGVGSGLLFTGSFYARVIEVRRGSELACVASIPPDAGGTPDTCSDGTFNGNETDEDCGGPDCDPCDDNLQCIEDIHCASGVCQGGICQVPNCSDGVQNGAGASTELGVDCGGACPACPAACTPGSYQAESMFKTTGNAWWQGGWNIYSNGYISTSHNFAGGPTVLTVSALGQNAWGLPHMTVMVDGVLAQPAAGVFVTTNGFNTYQFTLNVPAGNREVRVVYDNDASGWFGDRNLIVQTLDISCP
jgi:hypothetical protein